MFDVLFTHLEEKVDLTEEDKRRIPTYFTTKSLPKGGFLLHQGDHCRQLSFVSSGAMKSYTTDEKGNGYISLLAWEGWWVSDLTSFLTGQPAVLTVDAIEDTELLLLSRRHYEKLLAEVPVMERYFRILFQNSLATKDRRLISTNTSNAEEKYAELIAAYPFIRERIPQHLIAAHLGLAPETVSRVRKHVRPDKHAS